MYVDSENCLSSAFADLTLLAEEIATEKAGEGSEGGSQFQPLGQTRFGQRAKAEERHCWR